MKVLKVLIIESDDAIRDSLTDLLEIEGHEVTSFSSGSEALAAIPRLLVDLIFCDYGMPQMNGHELRVQLLQHEFHRKIPFYLMSARNFGEKTQENLQVNGILRKPFSLQDLALILHRHQS